jgi:Kef-type K+ transport system membrane component KefB
MKKVLVVAALLGIMLIVNHLKQAGGSSAATLAGIGFVMLAAYAVAELGKALSLPQVTGYILAGVVLGPSVGGIISGEVVDEMRMFNTLALGLIATSAGLELDVRQIARLGKTLFLTTLIKVVFGVTLVAGMFLLVESLLNSLGLQSRGELLTLALVLGVLSIGTSPSIALAVLRETRAKGRMADLVLGAAVFKDLVVIVGLAVAIAVGRVLLKPGATLDSSVLGHVALELAGSLLVGGLVGLLFIAYVRFIRAEMLLFVAAMILVVAELCRVVHLELLLVFIAAGFVVRNFSKYEHELMRPLELVALPVFVVFFANAGASVDLLTTWKILPLALALCATRALIYFMAGRLGGRWAGEATIIQKHAWLAYLPQAGVTLGLVGLAGLQLPELTTPITNTGMAVVALNLLIGPITLRRALGLAGELPPPEGAAAESAEVDAGGRGAPPARRSSPRPPAAPPPVSIDALPESLRDAHARLSSAIQERVERFLRHCRPDLPVLPTLGDKTPELEVFRQILASHRAAYRALYAELILVISQLAPVVDVQSPEDALRSTGRDARLHPARARQLPLRRLARIALGPAIAAYVARAFEQGLWGRAAGQAAPAPRDPRTGSDVEQTLPAELEAGLLTLAELMRDAGTRRLPLRRLRYSNVEPQVQKHLHTLSAGTELDLARQIQAAWGSRLLELRIGQVTTALREVVARCLVEPALASAARVGPAIEQLAAWLRTRESELENGSDSELTRLSSDFARLSTVELAELSRGFRFSATVRATLAEMKASVASVPARVECLVLDPGASLPDGKIQTVQLASHVALLIRHLMPPIDLAARSLSTALSQVPRRVDDAMRSEWTLLQTRADLARADQPPALEGERASEARRRLERVTQLTGHAVQQALLALDTAVNAACATFALEVLPGPAASGRREARLQSQLARLRRDLKRRRTQLSVKLFGGTPLADATALRRSLRAPDDAGLPETVRRWFDPAPVTDERIFAAHRRLFDHILDAESSRAEAGQSSVLIIGGKGSGKSSLLNMCELELPSATHLRLHASDFSGGTSLFEALGALLECPPTDAALSRHLAFRAPAVFVDDLPSWISASPRRQLELARFLRLIADTRRHAFWLVSIDTTLLALFNELENVEEVFTHLVRLPALGLEEVKHLVESRLEQLNVEVIFQPRRRNRWHARLGASRESERLYRALWLASGGVPARVVAACRAAFKVRGQQLSLRSDAIIPARAPDYRFDEVQLALLATVHRYGPQTLDRLARELAVSNERLQRSVAFLCACGILSPADEYHAVSIVRAAEWLVFETLVSARLVQG